MSFETFLDKTGNIERYVEGASDGQGGYAAPTWGALYRRVKFQLVVIQKQELIIQYDKEKVFAEYYVYLNSLSGLKEGDRLVWEGRYFYFKLLMDWQEKGRMMKIAVVEGGRNE